MIINLSDYYLKFELVIRALNLQQKIHI